MTDQTHDRSTAPLGSETGRRDTRQDRTAQPGQEPPADATSTTVVPFDQHEVPAGDWIVHALSYDQEPANQTSADVRRDLEQFLDRVTSTVRIDDLVIDDPEQYWGDPEQIADDRWTVEWRYATPPQPVGTEHTFELTWTFDPAFEPFDGTDTFERIETPGCTYRIVEGE